MTNPNQLQTQKPEDIHSNSIGEAAMALAETTTEQRTDILSPEFIEARDQYYRTSGNTLVIGGCSDERPETAESSAVIAQKLPEALPTTEGMLRVFGSKTGLAMAITTAGLVRNPSFAKNIGGINGAIQLIDSRMQAQGNIVALNHSDATKEGNASHLDVHARTAEGQPAPMGCAFSNLAGATADLLVNHAIVRELAVQRQAEIYNGNDHTEQLLEAEAQMLADGTEDKGGAFAITRADYTQDRNPTLVLAGTPHKLVKDTGVIFNFTNEIASPSRANADGKDFYSVDVVPAVESIMSMVPELDLDPQILAEALTLQSFAVCAALELQDADHQGDNNTLNPARLATGVRGDVRLALAKLQD